MATRHGNAPADDGVHTTTKMLHELHGSLHERLCAFARTLTSDRDEAEDLVQDLYHRIPPLLDGHPPIQNLGPFLCGWMRRVQANRRRRDARRRQLLSWKRHEAPDPTRRWDAEIVCGEILAMLPEHHADILRLRFLEEMSVAEIAEQLVITQNLVRVRLHRALSAARIAAVDTRETVG